MNSFMLEVKSFFLTLYCEMAGATMSDIEAL